MQIVAVEGVPAGDVCQMFDGNRRALFGEIDGQDGSDPDQLVSLAIICRHGKRAGIVLDLPFDVACKTKLEPVAAFRDRDVCGKVVTVPTGETARGIYAA